HPVCGASEASRLFINAAPTPPFQGGECARTYAGYEVQAAAGTMITQIEIDLDVESNIDILTTFGSRPELPLFQRVSGAIRQSIWKSPNNTNDINGAVALDERLQDDCTLQTG